MFISRSEAAARLKSSSNPFAESKDRDSKDWGSSVAVVDPSDDASHEKEPDPEPQPSQAEASPLKNYEADAILAQAKQVRSGGSLAHVPEDLRREVQAAIGASSSLLGPTAAGHLYDKSTVQTSAYGAAVTKHDHHYGANKQAPVPVLEQRLDAFKETLAMAAGKKLESTLAALTPQKLTEVKRATNLSKIARDMATVMDKVSDSGKSGEQSIHFHVYRPEMRSVNHYKSVSVGVGIGNGLSGRVEGTVVSGEVMPMPGVTDEAAAGYDAVSVQEALNLIPSYPEGSGLE